MWCLNQWHIIYTELVPLTQQYMVIAFDVLCVGAEHSEEPFETYEKIWPLHRSVPNDNVYVC